MSGFGLLTLSLTGGIVFLVALVTPGWLGLQINNGNSKVEITMSILYSEVCVTSDQMNVRTCLTMSNAEAMDKHLSASGMTHGDDMRFTEFIIEASLALIGVGIGTVLTALYAVSLINRERSNLPSQSSSSRGLPSAGLTFIIIGGICGGILGIEFINVHVKIDTVLDTLTTYGSKLPMTKSFPYSIVIMSVGLFVEFIAICVHISSMRTKARLDGGIILTPAVNAPTVVVQSSTTTSSVPYSQFA